MSQVNKVRTPLTSKKVDNISKNKVSSLKTKKTPNSSASSLITPVPKPVRKKREASTPTDDKKNSSVASFGDISNISVQNKALVEQSSIDDEFLYSNYLRTTFFESLIDKNLQDNSINIDNEIINLNKRLEQSRLLLEETDQNIKEITLLCEQSSLLKSHEETLQTAIEQENDVKESVRLEELRRTLQFSSNSLPTKNVTCEESFPQISVEGVNKLNLVLCNLQKELKNLDVTYGTSLQEINDLKEKLVESETTLNSIKKENNCVEHSQSELDKIAVQDMSRQLDGQQ